MYSCILLGHLLTQNWDARSHEHKMYCIATLRRVRATTIAVEKQLRITYSKCVFVALVIQSVMSISRIILSSVACLALP